MRCFHYVHLCCCTVAVCCITLRICWTYHPAYVCASGHITKCRCSFLDKTCCILELKFTCGSCPVQPQFGLLAMCTTHLYVCMYWISLRVVFVFLYCLLCCTSICCVFIPLHTGLVPCVLQVWMFLLIKDVLITLHTGIIQTPNFFHLLLCCSFMLKLFKFAF